ncbi:MAG TPA: hypothetical protein VE172_10005, partial [Stackebrandtia sp.]|uniref:hypothetical protein n=1 Tax=Stackebrandtia sp. TaxID=2023065 RepID=UPI002D5DDA79
MNDDQFRDLGLDDILEITANDAAHAPALREQGKGLKKLSDQLDASVTAALAARAGIEGRFEGASGQELHHRATRLVERGSQGHAALREQPGVFFELSDQAEVTHQRVLELRDERDAKLAHAPHGDHTEIRSTYDEHARQYMRQTTAGYVRSLRRADWMRGYTGPRVPRDGESNGPKGFAEHNTAGPSLSHVGPTLQSGSVGLANGSTLAAPTPSPA